MLGSHAGVGDSGSPVAEEVVRAPTENPPLLPAPPPSACWWIRNVDVRSKRTVELILRLQGEWRKLLIAGGGGVWCVCVGGGKGGAE